VTREEFEREFNSRTLAYLPGFKADDRAVVVSIGEGASSEPGHALAISLINMLARAHRRILVVGDLERRVLCRAPLGGDSLYDATIDLARAINPFIEVEMSERVPTDRLVHIGIGDPTAELPLGADGWLAMVGAGAAVAPGHWTLPGAGLAACVGAAVAFNRARGVEGLPSGAFSLWEYGAGSIAQGPPLDARVDVGDVLQVGAGAVGAALSWWLVLCGWAGRWWIADGDSVDVSNLNRQLMFVAADAGFPNVEPRNKAAGVAERMALEATASPHWWGEDGTLVDRDYDVILPLANERGARPLLQARSSTVLLHATTSRNWEAQVHRHVAGHDDCVPCRIPNESPGPMFGCSTGDVGQERRQDAALPFLSGTAGLLLMTALAKLQMGRLLDDKANYHALGFDGPAPYRQVITKQCRDGCSSWMADEQRIATARGRFADLDAARR
jgi:hypothetical protein